MFEDIWTIIVLLFAIIGVGVALLAAVANWDYRKQLRDTLESLRDCLCAAKSLVDQQPDNKAAKETHDRARKMYDLIEKGLRTRRNPYAILRAVASEVGVEMAISARFQAGARR